MHVDGAGLTSTALAISRLVRPTETRWSTSNSRRDNPVSSPLAARNGDALSGRSRRTFRRPGRRRPAATDEPSSPGGQCNAQRDQTNRRAAGSSRNRGALRGAQPATRFAVLAPFIPSRSSRKVFAHFSMSFSKTWRRITLIRRALLRGVSLMASSMASLRPLMS